MDFESLQTNYGFTKLESIIFRWQFKLMGGFETKLMDAIVLADEDNIAKLTKAYPDHVLAIIHWRHGHLHDELKAKMKTSPDVFAGFKL